MEYLESKNQENIDKTNSIVINNKIIDFNIENQKAFITSFDLAEVFDKQHKNILRDIENLPNDEFCKFNFELSSEIRKRGFFTGETKCYKITKDGFCLLAMGFTGEKAYKWKILFIEAFNKIEQELRNEIFKLACLEDKTSNNEIDLIRIEKKFNHLINQLQEEKNLQERIQDLQEDKIQLKDQIIDLQAEIITKNTKIKIDTSKNTLTPTEEKLIISLLREGKSVEEVSKVLNKGRTIVKKLSKYATYSNSYFKELQNLAK
ncbi:hypothetical protein BKH42_08195 [Helicobacter sp. 13S00482-2]|uniref:Rha family transcriptional regulator n=1 Tax=Helicobacter sp. 13S00482-2 TaxID=1476200 RepID=UPI000BA75F6A|nr:Rha family transcriptional regulator [Helicobacter sp. 13S00482-2]PAF53025.1 hypothetical protein BKH42_08195 [Helicobacter sp. 13S00482-2]